ncbi:hypothetical protein LCGC14_1042450, partial [marine sediment metagenome]
IQGNPEQMWAEPEAEEDGKAKTAKKKRPMYAGQSEAFKTAATTLYRNDQGEFWHPGQAFFDVLMLGCRGRKLGSSKAIDIVTTAVRVVEQEVLLYKPDSLAAKKPKLIGPKEWVVDRRRALNHNKKPPAGVVAIRGKWRAWGMLLALEVDCDVFHQDSKGRPELGGLTDLLTIAGSAFGIGVGRRRIKDVDRYGRETWSDMGMGRFKAELRE